MKTRTSQAATNACLRLMLVSALMAGFLVSAQPASVQAVGTIVVSSLADSVNTDGACTLREAIIAANRDQASSPNAGECPAGNGADTIILPSGTYVLTRNSSGNNSPSSGDLDINSSITISPTGPVTITAVDSFNDRIFVIDPGASLTLVNATLSNGNAGSDGGGIYNAGQLVLKNSALVNNKASGRGGGLYNAGTATLGNVTVSSNTSKLDGGGVFNRGTLNLNNVTIADNIADVTGSGAGNGGGIATNGGAATLKNTLIGGNADNSSVTRYPDCSGALTSQGYNLVQNVLGCSFTTTTGDITGKSPNLGPLQNNGGGTLTHALLTGSLAIDAANPARPGSGGAACEATDQRGMPRPYGAVCDIGAFEAGAFNIPVIIRAISLGVSGTQIYGRLSSAANATFTLRFYSAATCDAASLLANPLPGAYAVTTGNTGNTYFQTNISASVPDGQFVAATATDASGATSALSACVAAGPGNDSWPHAMRLTLAGVTPSASVDQYLDMFNQARWFKFTIQPGSKVVLALTQLPANYDLTLYKDIAAAYRTISTTQDLVRLGAEFAPDTFSPDTFSPDTFSPDTFSPDAFSPDSFSPDTFSPDTFSPDTFSPDTFSPDTFSPDTYSPDAYSPDTYSPDTYSPDTYSPDTYSPDTYSPDAYSSAQTRSLIGVSAFEGTASEGILVNTWENSGDFYVRVRGRNGAFSLQSPFHLQVLLVPGNCVSVTTNLPTSTIMPTASNARTIILTDLSRMLDSRAGKNALQTKLAALAARPEVAGTIVDVNSDARVAAANAQADAYPTCPTAKNIVAGAIKDIIARYRALNPLEYVVIVGNDSVIPFFRYPDNALLANEKNYAPPVRDNTASQASLKLGYVLSQDAYGSQVDISFKANTFPIPNLAVGRLVETAADASTVLDAYLGTNGGVVPTPSSALVTGYDFLADAAGAVQSELEAGLGRSADILITPRDISPSDPRSWTADQLRAQLLGNRHDLIFLAGHFSANSALAADYTTRMLSTDLVNSPVNLINALIFSAGCHAGYNIVNADGIPNVTREPDWAQAFARKGATLVAGTGYQYGDTDFIEYSERLYLEFSKQLRTGAGPVSIGKALITAKQVYLANTPQMRGIHEKALLEATLFGLPMLSINLPGARITPPSDAPVVSAVNSFTTNPGAALGLQFADVALTPTLTTHLVPLTVISSTAAALPAVVTATYLSGSDGIVANPAEPILPREVRNVSLPGTVLRGVGFRGGAYTDLTNVLPLLGAATTEIRGVHATFSSDYFYPVQPWSINYLDALANPASGATRLTVIPAQFKPTTPVAPTGTLRQFNTMNFRLYYSSNTATFGGGSVPALAAPPTIARVSGSVGAGSVSFRVNVVGNPAAGIQQVWVTYSTVKGDLAGQWQSLDLTQNAADSTLWTGTLNLNNTQPQDVRYIVQAVNGVGLVSSATNLGVYYIPGADTQPTAPTSLTLEMPAAQGAYGTRATFSAVLTSNGTPLANQTVSLALGPVGRQAATDANGRATVELPLLATPGTYDVRAAFNGAYPYLASSASASFTITKQTTTLTLVPQSSTTSSANQVRLTATLQAATGRRLANKAVFFIVSGNGNSFALEASTGPDGLALVDVGPLAAGTYVVNVYFSGYIPLPDHPITLVDESYLPATTNGTVTYRVAFNFTGFFSPVSNPPYLNTVNAGRAIPVKFSLGGNQGFNIFATGYPISQPMACNPSAPLNKVNQTTNDTTSSLSFNAGANQYVYVWKTDASWAGACRQLTLQFVDGTIQFAYFKFD